VERGDLAGDGLQPAMLISLTAPKAGVRAFAGPHHFLGVRGV
jgi:NAD(P)H-hydrate epimerase